MDAYPQTACPLAVHPMRELVGVKIGAGWQGEVRKRIILLIFDKENFSTF